MKEKHEKGYTLSLFDKVYSELDSTFIGASSLRNVPAKSRERYNYLTEMFAWDRGIQIKASTPERLDFAQKVAEHYGAEYIIGREPWRKNPNDRYFIKLILDEE